MSSSCIGIEYNITDEGLNTLCKTFGMQAFPLCIVDPKHSSNAGAYSECALKGRPGIVITEMTNSILRTVLTFSTCSVVKGPPYFDLP